MVCLCTDFRHPLKKGTEQKPKTPSIYQSGPTNQCGLLWEKALVMCAVHFHYHTTILSFWEAEIILSIDQITGKIR